ncbi:uncharacterized protein LOC129730272 [Wyeomyia smithii]|uniref:uncharacterized protein LOC129730272 n=1 Tax=Wyeomyia smithii TaxID=174621 RepID=UPI002467E734|nr:uncharacterized protein LOC129730272 [Wyeomyia smithii]
MSQNYDVFDNLNSYLNNNEDCDIPDDLGDSNIEESFLDQQPEPAPVVRKKRTAVLTNSQESLKSNSPQKRKPSTKREVEISSVDSSSESPCLIPSTSSLETARSSSPAPVEVSEPIHLNDDLDQQISEVQRQYDLLFSKGNNFDASEKRYFAGLKKQFQTLMKQRNAVKRRTRQNRASTFLNDLLALKELFYDICVNRNLLAPIQSCPAPADNRTRRRRNRQQAPEVINLVDSPALVLPGVVNLDSDEEDVPTAVANHSFDSDNYDISIKIKWQGSIERHTLRKHQKFADLIAQLAKDVNADPCRVILNLDEQIIDPNDTPDSIGYRITQFITGRVVEKKVLDMFAGKRSNSAKGQRKPSASTNTITLKVQSDRWKTPLQIAVGAEQTMKIVLIKCAEELKCAAGEIKLSFDGEAVELESTPSQLGLEDGEILDLRFVKA